MSEFKKDEVMPGQIYGELTVVGPILRTTRPPKKGTKSSYYYTVRCRCSCGSEAEYIAYHLLSGNKQQCSACGFAAVTTYYIEYQGKKMSLRAACALAGVSYFTVVNRVRVKMISPQDSFDYCKEKRELNLKFMQRGSERSAETERSKS